MHGTNVAWALVRGQTVYLVHTGIFTLFLKDMNFNKKRIQRYIQEYRFRPEVCIAEAEDEACSAESFV